MTCSVILIPQLRSGHFQDVLISHGPSTSLSAPCRPILLRVETLLTITLQRCEAHPGAAAAAAGAGRHDAADVGCDGWCSSLQRLQPIGEGARRIRQRPAQSEDLLSGWTCARRASALEPAKHAKPTRRPPARPATMQSMQSPPQPSNQATKQPSNRASKQPSKPGKPPSMRRKAHCQAELSLHPKCVTLRHMSKVHAGGLFVWSMEARMRQ